MDCHEKNINKEIIGMIENAHLLRKLFIHRTGGMCPLHFSQFAIMRMIQQNENCTQILLAEKLRVTPASVATSTKRLQKAGLITKTIDPENLRCKRLALTDSGRNTLQESRRVFDEYDSVVFEIFSDDEKVKFHDYLERLIVKMKSLEGINPSTNNSIELSMLLHRLAEFDNQPK